MLPYYLTAAGAFTLGFIAAAALISGRRAQNGRERAWLADEVTKFAAKCRRSSSEDDYRIAPADLQQLQDAATAANPLEK